MDNNWLNQIELPINKQDKTQYQILMTLMNIERLLNELVPKEKQMAVEDCVIEEIISVTDYTEMTKDELIKECERQGIEYNSRDSKTKLLDKLIK